MVKSPHKGIPEFGKFFLVQSGIQEILVVEGGILGFGIPNKAQGIRNPIKDWNLESN